MSQINFPNLTRVKPLTHSIRKIFQPQSRLHTAASGLLLIGFIGFNQTSLAINVAELDGNNGFQIQSVIKRDSNDDLVGHSIGDINGDGIADLLVGVTTDSSFNARNNSSLIVFGRADGSFTSMIEASQLNGHNGFIVKGNFLGSLDVNGDGITDLLFEPHPIDNRSAFVVLGHNVETDGDFIRVLDENHLDGTNGFRIGDPANTGSVNYSSQGDVSGDGLDDVIALESAYTGVNGHTRYHSVSLYVIFGKGDAVATQFAADFELSQMDGTDGFRIQDAFETYSDSTGEVNKGVELGTGNIDFNGDSINDIYTIHNKGGYRDLSYYGGFHAVSKLEVDGVFDAVINGRPSGLSNFTPGIVSDYYPGNINLIGDINGDDADDVISSYTGYSGNNDSIITFGRKDSESSPNGGKDIILRNTTSDYAFESFDKGHPLGDINGDGIDDVLIEQKNYYVLFGRDTAKQGTFPSLIDPEFFDGVNGFSISDPKSHGYTFATTKGDINGDNINDIILSNPTSNDDKVTVIFGRSTGFPRTFSTSELDDSTGLVIEGATSASRYIPLAGADVNADGGDDILIVTENPTDKNLNAYVVFGLPSHRKINMVPILYLLLNDEGSGFTPP